MLTVFRLAVAESLGAVASRRGDVASAAVCHGFGATSVCAAVTPFLQESLVPMQLLAALWLGRACWLCGWHIWCAVSLFVQVSSILL